MLEQSLGALFSDYVLDANYDEMFESAGMARPHCRALFQELRGASEAELSLRQLEADKAFLTQGHHLHRLRRRSGHRAHLPVRSAAAHHLRAGMADARARA